MKIAYLDCFSGISGDMFIGALIDAGFPLEELRKVLQSLPLEGYSLDATREERNHLFGTRFQVKVTGIPSLTGDSLTSETSFSREISAPL